MRNIKIPCFFCSIIVFTIISCRLIKDEDALVFEINERWEFSKAGEDDWLPAEVPGNLYADLIQNNILGDAYFGMSENDLQDINNKDWVYRTVFNIDEKFLCKDAVELEFKGLDAYAKVYLNDSLLLVTDSVFIGYILDVKKFLVEGENRLSIYFHSTNYSTGNFIEDSVSAYSLYYKDSEQPILAPCGVRRPVILRAIDKAGIEDVFVETLSVADQKAVLKGFVEVRVLQEGKYHLSLIADEESELFRATFNLSPGLHLLPVSFDILQPKLWWTNGLGDAYLYNFKFELINAGEKLSYREIDYGVRTLKLVQAKGEKGSRFYFEVNGQPVSIKGASVVALSDLYPADYESACKDLINNAVDANMNMLCVSREGFFDEDYFYELCDSSGILVWQDFYSKQPEYNMKRLRNHASLALWRNHTSCKIKELANMDSTEYKVRKVWSGKESFADYSENVPCLAMGYGFNSFPDMHSIKEFRSSGKWEFDLMLKSNLCNIAVDSAFKDMMFFYMKEYYKMPEKFDDLVYISQLSQANAYKTVIETHRRSMPYCMGSLYWQLNDSRLSISPSTIDYCGRRKAAHYAVKRANEKIILSSVVTGNRIRVFAVNDSFKSFNADLKGTLMGLNGTVLLSDKGPVTVGANTSTEIFEDTFGAFITPEMDISSLVLVLELMKKDSLIANEIVYMAEPKDLPLAKAKIKTSMEATDNGYKLTLTSNVLAKDVFVDTPYGDILFSDNYFDLLPNRPKTIELISSKKLDVEKDIIVKTLNDLI